MKYIVIGGVAGGATAAARIRRNTEQAEIILFEKGEYISYANCGLPYYIGGVIAEREKLFVQTPEAFGKRAYPVRGNRHPFCRENSGYSYFRRENLYGEL